MPQAILTVDLGFGDSGKGATVDYLCRKIGADLVIRYSGGAQAGHTVQLSDGRRHTFSQFGAGTIAGARTYLGPEVIVKPIGIRREAAALADMGVLNPMQGLTVNEECLVATEYHQDLNRQKETVRTHRSGRHGSCGLGIGEARSYWLKYGDDSIFAKDLKDRSTLERKLRLMRQRLLLELDELPSDDCHPEYDFYDKHPQRVAASLLENSADITTSNAIPDHQNVIFEASQGVLLDEYRGFHPYTTWSTVTLLHAQEMLQSLLVSKYDKITTLGITRAYTCRHGVGPFPTYSPELTQTILDKGNPHNAWQGSIRMGWLDMVLLRYAIRVCGGQLDGLVVNNLDELPDRSRYCSRYENAGKSIDELNHPERVGVQGQAALGKFLEQVQTPTIEASPQQILTLLNQIVPVVITSHGPTSEDRVQFGVL